MNGSEPLRVISTMTFRVFLLVVCSFVALVDQARAQDVPSSAAARSRASQASACLSSVTRRAERYVSLLLDAREQLSSSNEQVRRDAARAIVSLEQSIAELADEMRACVPDAAQLQTQEVEERLDPNEERVGQAGNAIQRVEENSTLSNRVQIRVGERVDGMGQVDAGALRSAVRRVSGAMDRCFERAQSGAGALVAFTVSPSGTVRQVSVEYVESAPAGLASCVSRVVRSIRVRPGARGGDARFSYHFRRR